MCKRGVDILSLLFAVLQLFLSCLVVERGEHREQRSLRAILFTGNGGDESRGNRAGSDFKEHQEERHRARHQGDQKKARQQVTAVDLLSYLEFK